MAAENVELSIQVVNLASEATETSKLTAVTRSRIDSIESDLLIARKLISLGNIDRRAGATLLISLWLTVMLWRRFKWSAASY